MKAPSSFQSAPYSFSSRLPRHLILRLKEDSEYYRQIAGQCIQCAFEYDIRKTVDAYLEVYKQLDKIL